MGQIPEKHDSLRTGEVVGRPEDIWLPAALYFNYDEVDNLPRQTFELADIQTLLADESGHHLPDGLVKALHMDKIMRWQSVESNKFFGYLFVGSDDTTSDTIPLHSATGVIELGRTPAYPNNVILPHRLRVSGLGRDSRGGARALGFEYSLITNRVVRANISVKESELPVAANEQDSQNNYVARFPTSPRDGYRTAGFITEAMYRRAPQLRAINFSDGTGGNGSLGVSTWSEEATRSFEMVLHTDGDYALHFTGPKQSDGWQLRFPSRLKSLTRLR